jgi:hypothetical protein
LEATNDVGGPAQSDQTKGGGGERRRVTFVTDHDPVNVDIHRLSNPARTRRVQAPLQMVSLDNHCTRNLAIRPPLKLWPDIDQNRAVPDCLADLLRSQARQPEPGSRKEAMQSMISTRVFAWVDRRRRPPNVVVVFRPVHATS